MANIPTTPTMLFNFTDMLKRLVQLTIEAPDNTPLIESFTDEVLYTAAYKVGAHWEKPIVNEAIHILEDAEPLEFQFENASTYLYPLGKPKTEEYYEASAHVAVVFLGLIVSSFHMRIAAREQLDHPETDYIAARLAAIRPLASTNAVDNLLVLLRNGRNEDQTDIADYEAALNTGISFVKAAISVNGARRSVLEPLIRRLDS